MTGISTPESQARPEPPADLSGDALDEWLEWREALQARGPRTLRFPDRPVGVLTLLSLEGSAIHQDARGTVQVPHYSKARLVLTSVAQKEQSEAPQPKADEEIDHSFLGHLDPDDLETLVAEPADAGTLSAAAHLSGVRRVVLTGAFGDEVFDTLAAMRQLELIALTGDGVTGAGMQRLAGGRVRTLVLRGSTLVPGFADALSSFTALKALSLTTSHADLRLLRAVASLQDLVRVELKVESLDEEGLVLLGAKLPHLRELSVRKAGNDSQPLPRAAELALRLALPELHINDCWMAPAAVRRALARLAPAAPADSPPSAPSPLHD